MYMRKAVFTQQARPSQRMEILGLGRSMQSRHSPSGMLADVKIA
jgi:hypothetical protein